MGNSYERERKEISSKKDDDLKLECLRKRWDIHCFEKNESNLFVSRSLVKEPPRRRKQDHADPLRRRDNANKSSHVLVVAQQDYFHFPSVKSMNSASNFIWAIEELRNKIVYDVSVSWCFLVNQSYISLINRLEEFCVKVQFGDEVYVYYTGHGSNFRGIPCFVSIDNNRKICATPISDFLDKLFQRGPSFVFVLLDCSDSFDCSKKLLKSSGGLNDLYNIVGDKIAIVQLCPPNRQFPVGSKGDEETASHGVCGKKKTSSVITESQALFSFENAGYQSSETDCDAKSQFFLDIHSDLSTSKLDSEIQSSVALELAINRPDFLKSSHVTWDSDWELSGESICCELDCSNDSSSGLSSGDFKSDSSVYSCSTSQAQDLLCKTREEPTCNISGSPEDPKNSEKLSGYICEGALLRESTCPTPANLTGLGHDSEIADPLSSEEPREAGEPREAEPGPGITLWLESKLKEPSLPETVLNFRKLFVHDSPSARDLDKVALVEGHGPFFLTGSHLSIVILEMVRRPDVSSLTSLVKVIMLIRKHHKCKVGIPWVFTNIDED